MTNPHRIVLSSLVSIALALCLACERPPPETVQGNFRGLGIEQVHNPRTLAALLAANEAPKPIAPVAPAGGPASANFKNVQVLGDLQTTEFARLMTAMTSWVAPQQGCNYCHTPGDFASDAVYQKVVARRMLQMVREINTKWPEHVRDTGVTCYTCHRGQNLPQYVWSRDPGPPHAFAAGNKAGQNTPSMRVGLTSLPFDPLWAYLAEADQIRVQSTTALPAADHTSIKNAEGTYALMMHISKSLGVNCGYCHNTRSFMPWEASSPARVNAWYAIRMVRTANSEYIGSLASVLPASRKGPMGDPLKVNCETCHHGLPKPLQGAKMAKDYAGLGIAAPTP